MTWFIQRLIIISLISVFFLPRVVFSAVQVAPNIDVLDALARIANWLWTILLVSAVIAIIIAGYMFVTSAGDPSQISRAWHFGIYALIGVIVAGLAYGLVSLIRRAVGG